MEEAEVFELNGVLMVRDSSGDEMSLADVMSYMNKGMTYDSASAEPMYATPPRADMPTPATPERQNTFGDTAAYMAQPMLQGAARTATNAGRRPIQSSPYVPDAVQRAGQYVGDMGMAAMQGLGGLLYGGVGLAGDVVGGSQQNERRFAKDMAGALDVSGIGPEARALSLLNPSDAMKYRRK